jgi:phage terminase large subunit-like protein
MTKPARRAQGKFERLCMERHARDLELSRRPGGHPKGLHFDPEKGERVVKFVEGYCAHHKGEWAGKPLTLMDWQKEIIRQAFGWIRADGTRRFRTAYWEIARKNGKSTLAAGIGLYLTVGDQEPGAEVYSSATKKDQAKIVWDEASKTVKKSPKLQRFMKAYRNTLSCERLGSKFEPLSSDSQTLDGLNPHGNIIDELHAHRDRGVWDVLDTAMGARRQPLTLAITTAGTYDAESIGWQMHDYAAKVLEGVIEDDAFHAFIAAADEGDDYFSEQAQQKANPNWGVSVKPVYLAEQAEKARRQPHFTNEYFRLHLNVWTQQVKRWLSVEHWAASDPAAGTRAAAIEREAQLAGRSCFGGLDLSSKLDLAALVLAFPAEEGDLIDVVCRFWLPESTIDRYAKKGQRHYKVWADDGWLTATPGDVIDYEFIRKEVNDLVKVYSLRELAFDPWGATDLATRLMGDGIQMVETRQGFKTLSEPSKDLEARVISKKIRHGGDPVLRFCVSNAVTVTDSAGNIKPDKAKASDRIDGVVALVMALSRVITANGPAENPYEERGFLQL